MYMYSIYFLRTKAERFINLNSYVDRGCCIQGMRIYGLYILLYGAAWKIGQNNIKHSTT